MLIDVKDILILLWASQVIIEVLGHHLVKLHLVQECRAIRRDARAEDDAATEDAILVLGVFIVGVSFASDGVGRPLNLVATEVAIDPQRVDKRRDRELVECHLRDYLVGRGGTALRSWST